MVLVPVAVAVEAARQFQVLRCRLLAARSTVLLPAMAVQPPPQPTVLLFHPQALRQGAGEAARATVIARASALCSKLWW